MGVLLSCLASETEVLERAEQWDQAVSEYIHLSEKYLGFQQPHSVYRFAHAGDGHRRVSNTPPLLLLFFLPNFSVRLYQCLVF